MTNKYYELLQGDSFLESFLMEITQLEWPNTYSFDIWSSNDCICYRIYVATVLEFHYLRIGTNPLGPAGVGLPLDAIYLSYGEEYNYWCERIAAFARQGLDSGELPICIEFDSHLFANRKRELTISDKNIGMLVVCRSFEIEVNYSYQGPQPAPYNIPSSE